MKDGGGRLEGEQCHVFTRGEYSRFLSRYCANSHYPKVRRGGGGGGTEPLLTSLATRQWDR